MCLLDLFLDGFVMIRVLKLITFICCFSVLAACSSNYQGGSAGEEADITQPEKAKSTRCTSVKTTGSRLPSKRC